MFRTRQKHFDENKWEKFRKWPKHFEENQWRKLRTRQIQYDNICTLFRSHGWNIVNFIRLRKIRVAFRSRLFWKCVRTVFWSQSWNQLWFWGYKIHELTWNQDLFQNAPQSPFISTQDNKKVKVCFKVHTSLDIQISPHPTILMCSTSWALIRRKSDNESWDTVQTSKRLARSLSSRSLLSKGKPPTTDSHNRELLETHCWMSQWLGCIQVLEFKLNHLQFHQPGKACLQPKT